MSLLKHPHDDFTFEVEATPLSAPDSDLMATAWSTALKMPLCYAFTIGSDGHYAVLRVMGNEETVLVDWQQFPHVRRGKQTNRLRVACAGPTCRFYINDEYATTVEDDTWLAGDVEPWERSFEDEGVDVWFLTASVWMER